MNAIYGFPFMIESGQIAALDHSMRSLREKVDGTAESGNGPAAVSSGHDLISLGLHLFRFGRSLEER